MLVKRWDKLPIDMQNDAVRPYYEILRKKAVSLLVKRLFDIVMSIVLLVVLSPVFLIVSLFIKADSKGPVFYRQERVTQYGKRFKIFKFRTMVVNADKIGSLVTINNDPRVTKIGKKLRKYRLDEIPQLLNIFTGDMTFVGTRPEVPKYVACYTDEMKATLLLPAGVTSKASIEYKNEEKILKEAENTDEVYVERILGEKMRINIESIRSFSFFSDMVLLLRTCLAVL
ncbi:Sugar transferase involved in LPS biosynthesis (colanic, teichoic acid) [Sphaerochaeta associata]|uniref:Sugar transferase n=1 Tax=Sphaerochaeta associata TaxID=1129264 RepID=A0ABY4DAX9_9SPIR|nr:sugar transferase [Sphaerochaeta associata]UOM51428.1 sugar transferase [Sphaerochaeta associata]SMP62381.1 Sugar transferase involved in LPS biosynthesis (colanic, teichoic acid) [Sphaerochaeta associata]